MFDRRKSFLQKYFSKIFGIFFGKKNFLRKFATFLTVDKSCRIFTEISKRINRYIVIFFVIISDKVAYTNLLGVAINNCQYLILIYLIPVSKYTETIVVFYGFVVGAICLLPENCVHFHGERVIVYQILGS